MPGGKGGAFIPVPGSRREGWRFHTHLVDVAQHDHHRRRDVLRGVEAGPADEDAADAGDADVAPVARAPAAHRRPAVLLAKAESGAGDDDKPDRVVEQHHAGERDVDRLDRDEPALEQLLADDARDV
eukprot:1820934-Prymnesium_polylepis.1